MKMGLCMCAILILPMLLYFNLTLSTLIFSLISLHMYMYLIFCMISFHQIRRYYGHCGVNRTKGERGILRDWKERKI